MAMTPVAQATVTIIPTMKGAQKQIAKDLGASVGSTGDSAGKSLGSKIVGGLKKVGTAVAIGKIIGDSLNEGAKLQQSLGGIETLFKENADTVKGYAADAYKTAGLSANEYMENVTSFSAALIKSMDGDTAAAAEMANMAMVDMADNANKMGTDMNSIQNAYQGFAKGQYTMLDNLKLGYGGTKGEMERLLADASKLSGVEYNIDNLDDVYEAIHVIQTDLDITGTTAKEAATTFAGSFASMKAAATNLLGNLAIGGDVEKSMRQLAGTVETFLIGNVLPMIGSIVQQLPAVLAKLPGFIGEMLPDFIAAAADIVEGLITGIIDNFPTFINGMIELFGQLEDAIADINWGEIAGNILNSLSTAMESVWPLIQDLFKAQFGVELPDWETVKADIGALWNTVKENIGEFFKAAFDIITDDDKSITEKISALWTLVSESISGLFQVVFDVVNPIATEIVTKISNWWGENVWPEIQDFFLATFGIHLDDWNTVVTNIQTWWGEVTAGISDFFHQTFEIWTDPSTTVVEKLKKFWDLVTAGIAGYYKAVFQIIAPVISTVVTAISNWWGKSVWPLIQDVFKALFDIDLPDWDVIVERIKSFWNDVQAGIIEFFKSPFTVIVEGAEAVIGLIDKFWATIWNGIVNWFQTTFHVHIPTWEEIKQAVSTFWNNFKGGIATWFSTVFHVKIPSWSDIKNSVQTFWNKFRSGIGGWFKKTFTVTMPSWENVKTRISTGWKTITGKVGEIVKSVFDVAMPILDDIVEGIKAFWGDVVKGIGDFLTLKWVLGTPETKEMSKTLGQQIAEMRNGETTYDVKGDQVKIDSKAIQDALADANLSLGDIDTGSLDTALASVTACVGAMEKEFSNMSLVIPAVKATALTLAKAAVTAAVATIKSSMKFTWSLPTLHGKLPNISVNMKTASSSDGKTNVSYPELSVGSYKWFAEGAIFNSPQIIGIGDSKGPEAALPLEKLWTQLGREFDEHLGSGAASVTNNITVNGAKDPAAYATVLAREIKQQLKRA